MKNSSFGSILKIFLVFGIIGLTAVFVVPALDKSAIMWYT